MYNFIPFITYVFAYIVDTVASCFHCNEVVTATVSTTTGLMYVQYVMYEVVIMK